MSKRSLSAIVMCLADPSGNPRPLRVIHLLRSMGFDVDTVSYAIRNNLPLRNHFEIPPVVKNPKFKIFRKIFIGLGLLFTHLPVPVSYLASIIFLWFRLGDVREKLVCFHYDLLIVEDLFLLPLAFLCKNNAKIIFDAREYYPRQREGDVFFKLFESSIRYKICRAYLNRCDKVFTVSDGLAMEYLREFNVYADVIKSTPFYFELQSQPVLENKIKLVHHGLAHANRNLENMIHLMRYLDERFTLDLFLTPDNEYLRFLKKISADNSKIFFRDPVSFNLIVPTLNGYDIGIFIHEFSTFNLRHCLPNKFFEFIQARLMVLVSDSPDMARIVHEYGCGVVTKSSDAEEIASMLNSISPEQVREYKRNSDKAAHVFNWGCESEKLKSILCDLL